MFGGGCLLAQGCTAEGSRHSRLLSAPPAVLRQSTHTRHRAAARPRPLPTPRFSCVASTVLSRRGISSPNLSDPSEAVDDVKMGLSVCSPPRPHSGGVVASTHTHASPMSLSQPAGSTSTAWRPRKVPGKWPAAEAGSSSAPYPRSTCEDGALSLSRANPLLGGRDGFSIQLSRTSSWRPRWLPWRSGGYFTFS